MSEAPASALGQALKSAVARQSRVHAWQIRSLHRRGFQTYLVKTEPEAERRTESETHELLLLVKNGSMLGRTTIVIAPGDEAMLAERVEQAVFMAGLGGDATWDLPGTSNWPQVEVHDPALAGDKASKTSRAIVDAWRTAVESQKRVRPSSMELFCGEEMTRLENSAGLVAHATSTQVSLLTLLLAEGKRLSERYSWDECRRAADLDVAAVVRRVAEEASDLTEAVVPPSGQYPVVLDADVITDFLSPIRGNASAESLYQKFSRFEVGKPIPVEIKGGEPLNVASNALAPYGLASYAFDDGGVPGRRVDIVKDGVLVRPWATKQFADYLGTEPTGAFANWEIPPGSAALADLTGGDRVLLVRAFSWLTPDQARGNFGSEVRIGYLYEKGVRTPIKGGTVSGNVFGALGTARFSRETVFRGDYMGPAAVRLENLTVAGA